MGAPVSPRSTAHPGNKNPSNNLRRRSIPALCSALFIRVLMPGCPLPASIGHALRRAIERTLLNVKQIIH